MYTNNHLIYAELKASQFAFLARAFIFLVLILLSFLLFKLAYIILIFILLSIGWYLYQKVDQPISISQIEYEKWIIYYQHNKSCQLHIRKITNYYFCFALYSQEGKQVIIWRDQVNQELIKKLYLFSKLH